MSLRGKVWAVLDVILRVPPVFVMDALLNSGLGLSSNANSSSSEDLPLDKKEIVSEINSTHIEDAFYFILWDVTTIFWFILYSQGFMIAFIVFLLQTQQLLLVYMWLSSLGVILWSYVWNEEFVKYATDLSDKDSSLLYEVVTFNKEAVFKTCGNYVLQLFFAMIFCFSHSPVQHFPPLRMALMCFVFIGPTLAGVGFFLLPRTVVLITPVLAALVAYCFIFFNTIAHGDNIYNTVLSSASWCREVVRHYGIYTLLENQWARLHVPQVLRVFWLTRLTEQAAFLLADDVQDVQGVSVAVGNLFSVSKELIVRGCETIIALLGMTSVVSSLSHYIGCAMHSFLMLEDAEDRNIGTVSAILFFILALQTGLTSMEPEKRLLRLYRNVCLLCTAVLHFIHNMVNPLLMSLSASRNNSIKKHSRALILCAFLILFPCWLLTNLWSRHSVSTWLLAVTAFSIEVVIKVVISLLVYLLFMLDAYRNTFWEKLDDYVYYIRATGNTIEFIFGIFLFFNGAWILLFESGGTIRAFMMCIHAYFNIWQQAKNGWKVFMRRRSAVNKINSLPEASPLQLREFDDVCAICYQELNTARITRCNHFFHGVCLRKWLYVQDICPLCHSTLYSADFEEASNSSDDLNNEHED